MAIQLGASAGNATTGDVLSGITFSNATQQNLAGTMPNQGSNGFTPSGSAAITIPAGYYDGSGTVAQVSVPASDVLSGTTIAGINGTMPNQGSPTLQPGQGIALGYYSGGNAASPGSGTQAFTTPGSYSFTVPSGVTRLLIQAIGGGGGGGVASSTVGGGGGGGGGCGFETIAVTPGDTVTGQVGAGGGSGAAGTASTVIYGGVTIITAEGGTAGTDAVMGTGGSVTLSGTTLTDSTNAGGGTGASLPSNAYGTGGSAGASVGNPGATATLDTSIGASGTGATIGNMQGGGAGGAGSTSSTTTPGNGAVYGGGGGGSYAGAASPYNVGGTGGGGVVWFVW